MNRWLKVWEEGSKCRGSYGVGLRLRLFVSGKVMVQVGTMY